MKIRHLIVAILFSGPLNIAHAENAVIEGMQEYMDFSGYEAGIIVPQQIDQTVFEAALFVDTRDAGQFEKETIPGAINRVAPSAESD